MKWNDYVTISLYIILFILNSCSWYKYYKKTSVDQRKKEGWNGYYIISTVFILMLLCERLGV